MFLKALHLILKKNKIKKCNDIAKQSKATKGEAISQFHPYNKTMVP